jgi:CheY-like chemotaxis protein
MNKSFALIVEDNTLLSNLFSRALQDIDYETLVINDGREALDWLMKREPDLLLLDMHLPFVSGKDILDKISGNPRFANTYITIVTADARMGEMLAEKASFLLNKPVDIAQLQQFAQRLKNKKDQPGKIIA